MELAGKLTNAQVELLKLFSYNLPDHQLVEMKSLLSRYFADVASKEMDALWEKNNWTNDTMNDWANEDLRKSP